jgi:predicted Zn-dependent protease
MGNSKKSSFKFLIVGVLSFVCISASSQIPGNLLKGLGGQDKKDTKQQGVQGAEASKENNPMGAVGGMIRLATSTQGDDEEIKVGEGVAASVLGAAKPYGNTKVNNYVNLVGKAIALKSDRKNLPWTFALIETSSINAFAAPGGMILITTGLYELLDSEDELAAVLAHEIAHVNKQHHYKVIKQQKMVEMGSNLFQKELSKDKENAIAKKMVGMGAELIARGLDKDSEFEADRDGMVLAARAGYDSSAMLSVLSKLQKKGGSDGSLQLLFKTHPSPSDRMTKLSSVLSPELEAAAVVSSASSRILTEGK